MVIVYTRPGCPACVGTLRYLERHQVPYVTFDVTEDPDAAKMVADLGYSSLPVVLASAGVHWSGLRIDRLIGLAAKH